MHTLSRLGPLNLRPVLFILAACAKPNQPDSPLIAGHDQGCAGLGCRGVMTVLAPHLNLGRGVSASEPQGPFHDC